MLMWLFVFVDRHFGLSRRRIFDCCRTLSTPRMIIPQWPRPMEKARAGRLPVGILSQQCDELGRTGSRGWRLYEGGIDGKECSSHSGVECASKGV